MIKPIHIKNKSIITFNIILYKLQLKTFISKYNRFHKTFLRLKNKRIQGINNL